MFSSLGILLSRHSVEVVRGILREYLGERVAVQQKVNDLQHNSHITTENSKNMKKIKNKQCTKCADFKSPPVEMLDNE